MCDQMKDETCESYSTHGKDKYIRKQFQSENLKQRDFRKLNRRTLLLGFLSSGSQPTCRSHFYLDEFERFCVTPSKS